MTCADRELLAVLNGITPRESAWVIVFANKKHMCDKIVKRLKANMWEAVAIHGDKDQRERSKALERFKSGAASARFLALSRSLLQCCSVTVFWLGRLTRHAPCRSCQGDCRNRRSRERP